MKNCAAVMTRNPVCCLPGDMVFKVAHLMKRDNIGSVPVIENDESQNLVGIITDRDLAMTVVGEGRDPGSTRVESVMSRTMVTLHPEDDLQKALGAMSAHQIRRIVIVDVNNKLLGIISQADIATRLNLLEITGKIVKDISQP